jgi:C-terminal processing protease CtpA/Prc
MGYSLRFYYAYANNENDVIAVVEYVEPEAPADKAGLKRGDLIIKVNGENLTVNNYSDLYALEDLTVGLGTYVNGELEDLSPSYNLYAEEIQVNPILVNTVFENGGSKVGYLAFTSFISEYDEDLKAVFAGFKSQGITDLIIDLRYNGGGSVATAKLLAGMIGPTSMEGDVFIRTAYNEILTDYITEENPNEPEWYNDYFESYENNLNLSRLYVLTTAATASASEMVMYTLMPYMDVIQIGEQTHGKYYASITIDDQDNHNWAIQPIIMRAENKNNSIDYSQGLIPDSDIRDDYTYQLGDQKDLLTATALDMIWGGSIAQESLKNAQVLPFKENDKLRAKKNPMSFEMFVDKEFK